MKKRQIFSNPCLALLLFFTFSMLVIGCGRKNATKAKTVKAEGKKLMENNSDNTNKDSMDEGDPSEINTTQSTLINGQIQIEEWKQLLGDLRNALGDIKKDTEQVR
ncbi:MAG: hypothetical protein HOL31_21305 [Candidatus Scalindua sp.]|jgi:hypothetical protein|nr:hypothetical protein [Candidatus Scalindua sp.]MBT7350477.1 hypothetical protein [candidate division WWE3 bacterium]